MDGINTAGQKEKTVFVVQEKKALDILIDQSWVLMWWRDGWHCHLIHVSVFIWVALNPVTFVLG